MRRRKQLQDVVGERGSWRIVDVVLKLVFPVDAVERGHWTGNLDWTTAAHKLDLFECWPLEGVRVPTANGHGPKRVCKTELLAHSWTFRAFAKNNGHDEGDLIALVSERDSPTEELRRQTCQSVTKNS
jgi:hypothetical protein